MSWHLFKTTLYQRRTALLWYSVGLAFYSAFIVWYFPYMSQADLKELISSMPKELLAFFSGRSLSIFTFGGFLAIEYLGFMWILIASAAVMTFALKSYAGEIAAGTMELLLAQPISRRAVAVSRSAALAVYVIVLVLATVVPIQLTAEAYDIAYEAGHLWLFAGVGTLLLLAIGGVAMLAAAASRESGKPAGVLGGILGVMWLLHVLAENADWANALEPANIFRYWDPGTIIDAGTVESSVWWVLTGIAVVSLVASAVVFSRRDVA